MSKKLVIVGVLVAYKWSHFSGAGAQFEVVDSSQRWIKKAYQLLLGPITGDEEFMNRLNKVFGDDLRGLKLKLVLEK